MPVAMWLRYKELSIKIVRDKLQAPLAQRKGVNKAVSQTSCVEAVCGLIEELLDAFIDEIDEAEGEKLREREELS